MLQKVISMEGNGARPSHMGKGFSEDGTMYTLNTIEQHSVCYTMNSKQISMMTTKNKANTIAADDYKEPQVVCYAIENHPCDSRVTMDDSGIVQTLNARMGTGGGNVPLVLMMPIERNCYAIDSHPGDSRIGIAGEISPTITVKIAKASSDGPLVLLEKQ